MSNRSDWDATLRAVGAGLRLQHRTPVGQKGLGVPSSDHELWRIGGEWLASRGITSQVPQGPDVYIATNIFRSGGHTLLIGDFVRALSDASDHDQEPRLIITNTSDGPAEVDGVALSRTGIASSHTTILPGPSLVDRLDQLLEALVEIRPRRLFLFHHPDDPVPVAAARSEIAGQRVLVHHADGRLCLGLHLPAIQLIDLNPIAIATSRLQGLAPALLRLTCPDPGSRPEGFLRRQQLVTATSATLAKVTQPHFYTYTDTVAVMLQATGGWHVHIGELDDKTMTAVRTALHRSNVSEDQFVHVPWAQSVAKTLWEHNVDVYVSSFPVDGARTNVEVMASGTPHLRHVARPGDDVAEIALAGGLAWHTWEDLVVTLRRLASRELLDERSRLIRDAYESQHHPRVFAACLKQILADGRGAIDSRQDDLDRRAVRSLANATAATALQLAQRAGDDSTPARFVRWLLRT